MANMIYHLKTNPSLIVTIPQDVDNSDFFDVFKAQVDELLHCDSIVYDYGEGWITMAQDIEHLNYFTFILN